MNLRKYILHAFGILLCACLMLCVLPTVNALEQGYDCATGNNKNNHDYRYSRWAAPINCYLVPNLDGTFTRVEISSEGVAVETFDSQLCFVGGGRVEKELPIFGGFYSGSNSNYLVFGQTNYEESDTKEVIRVVRYTKDWVRVGSASLYGANTVSPFEAGTLRFAEYGNYLYIRTAHKMYTSSDGLNHQANLSMNVRTSDMVITDSFCGVWNLSIGYVSHSFNQFIGIDNGQILAVDHGDAYPRSVVLMRYYNSAGQDAFISSVDYVEVLPINGSFGHNDTGVELGGFEISDSHYLIAGNTVSQGSDYSPYGQRNIFVAVTSRSNFSSSGTMIRYFTQYTSGDNVEISNPHFVKINPTRYLLLWREWGGSFNGLRYMYVDGTGSQISPVYNASGELSDCQPVVANGKVVWYVTTNYNVPVFYTIDLNTNQLSKTFAVTYFANGGTGAPRPQCKVEGNDLVLTTDKPTREGYAFMGWGPTDYATSITYKPGDTYSNDDNLKLYAVWQEYLDTPKVTEVKNTKNGIRLTWNPVEGAELYRVFIKNSKGWKSVGTTDNTTFVYTGAESGSQYTFTVCCMNEDDTVRISGYNRTGWRKTYIAQPQITGLKNQADGVKISWNAVPGAAKYRIVVKTASSGWKTIANTTATSFTWKNATSGVYYTFGVCCTTSDGKTYTSSFDSVGKGIRYIAQPSISSMSTASSGIKLTWKAVPGAASYRIVVKTATSGWKTIANTKNTSFTWKNAAVGVKYTFGICCTTADGKHCTSSFNSKGWQHVRLAQPKITNLENTADGIRITWKAVAGAAKYRILVKTSDGWKTLWNTSKTSYTWTGAQSGKTYVFTVRCLSADGKYYTSSFNSTGWSRKYIDEPAISSLQNTSSGIKLTWKTVPGAAKYKIVVKTPNTGWKTIGYTSGNTFTWTGATKGVTYTFGICCVVKEPIELPLAD